MEYLEYIHMAKPNVKLYGGKGSNLLKLYHGGFNVPPGFIINSESFKLFLNKSSIESKISQILSKKYQPKDIMQISNKIQNLFLKAKIPTIIITEIEEAYNKTREEFGERVSLAVRSSANIEDTKEFSFAGQAETYLCNKENQDILDSLKKCWASLFSPQALLYLYQIRKKDIEISPLELEMAVIVQKMINSQISGVLFTINVINDNQNEMMINSTWGLGDTVTNNSVIPDLIIINKNEFNVLKKEIGEKEKTSIPNPKGISTILIPTDLALRKVCSLKDLYIEQLFLIGKKIEDYFQYPQDIEWSIENDIIYILQSRPITALN
ncbi:MAG: PEP/pyruvate-binding domain-containing protein [Candidatus Heimdallarchaeota archaeon]